VKNKFILGTVQFGLDYGINNSTGKPSPEQVFKMLEYAASQDIRIIDTADAYGNAIELLGVFNKSNTGSFSINTKFKYNKEPLSLQLSKSLNLLHVNTINTYFYHSFSDFVNFPGLMSELVTLKQQKLISKIGVSVYDNSEFKLAVDSSEIDTIQIPFNLLDNRHQRSELMQLAKLKGKELQARSVFLQGLFFKPVDCIPAKLAPLKTYLKILYGLSSENNLSLEKLALLYALQQPEIDHVIIGVDNLDQLKNNLNIGQQNLSTEITELINQIAILETELLCPKNWN
jgi:aryl-alcohol dehydrogenase-like predicted oxidoreductase